MTDTEITEAYFKARGWTYESNAINKYFWWMPDKQLGRQVTYGLELPPILTDYPVFKEHVLEVMGEETGKDGKQNYQLAFDGSVAWWWTESYGVISEYRERDAEGHILRAAVIAATRYFEGKK